MCVLSCYIVLVISCKYHSSEFQEVIEKPYVKSHAYAKKQTQHNKSPHIRYSLASNSGHKRSKRNHVYHNNTNRKTTALKLWTDLHWANQHLFRPTSLISSLWRVSHHTQRENETSWYIRMSSVRPPRTAHSPRHTQPRPVPTVKGHCSNRHHQRIGTPT
jgi:hypothetical protein